MPERRRSNRPRARVWDGLAKPWEVRDHRRSDAPLNDSSGNYSADGKKLRRVCGTEPVVCTAASLFLCFRVHSCDFCRVNVAIKTAL